MLFGAEARAKIVAGIEAMAKAVGTTLGPKGRNVVINRVLGPPHVTKDGVTVARDVRPVDEFERMGSRILRGAAEKQCEEVGDGTTTVTILANYIGQEGMRLLAGKMNPMDIKRGIDAAALMVMNQLSDIAQQIGEDKEQVLKVALVSTNGDLEIAEAITEAVVGVGVGGSVTVEESPNNQTSVEMVGGLKIEAGFASGYFINNFAKGVCELDDPVILVFDGNLAKPSEVNPILEKVVAEGRQLLIVAEKYEDAIMKTLIINRQQGTLRCCAIRAPGFSTARAEFLRDLATVTGTQVISKISTKRLQDLEVKDLGQARSVVVHPGHTVVVDGKGDEEKIEARLEELRRIIADKTGDEKTENEKKLASITGKVAILKVGAATQIEMQERKDRVDDAIHATRAAIRGGIVAGGGAPLVHIAKHIKDNLNKPTDRNADLSAGMNILLDSLSRPARMIAENAGVSAEKIVLQIEKGGEAKTSDSEIDFAYGYDAQNDEFGNLIEFGIIDPAEVVIASVRNAASIGGLIITTECLIKERTIEKEKA